MIIFCEGNNTKIPVVKGRTGGWVEDDSVLTLFLPVYSSANTTQVRIELFQNMTCELALDLMTGIHSACTDETAGGKKRGAADMLVRSKPNE